MVQAIVSFRSGPEIVHVCEIVEPPDVIVMVIDVPANVIVIVVVDVAVEPG